jgi:hypothetical protein
MNDQMKQALTLFEAAWAERDQTVRLETLARCFAEDGQYIDPQTNVTGAAELSKVIDHFLNETLPGGSMRITSGVDEHDSFARYEWTAWDASGAEVLTGIDFTQFTSGGLVQRVLGFFGPLPKAE